MRADPDNSTQEDDHERGNPPDNYLDPAGVCPVGEIASSGVASSKPPGEGCDAPVSSRYKRGLADVSQPFAPELLVAGVTNA